MASMKRKNPNWNRVESMEDQPGPEWEQLTAWMNKKNPNWKRVEPKMRALAVRRGRYSRECEEDERMEGLCREAAEWLPIVSEDPTAIARMPDTYQSLPFSPSNKDLFLKLRFPPPSPSPFNPSIAADKYLSLHRPRSVISPPSPPWSLPPPPRLMDRSSLDEMYKKFMKVWKPRHLTPEEKEGLKMIVITALEDMRDRMPPESNQRRCFEAMLKTQE
ncbi:hypothetical protein OROGR_014781 [Orobanche gracilis]